MELELATTEQLVEELLNRLDVMKARYVLAVQLEHNEKSGGDPEVTIMVYNKKYLKKAERWFMRVFGGIALD